MRTFRCIVLIVIIPALFRHYSGISPAAGVQPADTSTGITLNALKTSFLRHSDVYTVCQYPYVTTNHFDVDSFIPIWCFLNRQARRQTRLVVTQTLIVQVFHVGFAAYGFGVKRQS